MTLPIIWHPSGVALLKADPILAQNILEQVEPVVVEAKTNAPKRTGRGAASIRAEFVRDQDENHVRIGWDVDHYYLKFHERGTKYLDARPFLVPALDKYLSRS